MSDRAPGGRPPEDPGEPRDRRDPRQDVRIDATVLGRVQGVGFRWFVLDLARELELRGWVSNEADGSVRCVAEGPPEALQALLGELGRGPLGARVERVIPRWGRAVGGLGPFEIRSGHHRGD